MILPINEREAKCKIGLVKFRISLRFIQATLADPKVSIYLSALVATLPVPDESSAPTTV